MFDIQKSLFFQKYNFSLSSIILLLPVAKESFAKSLQKVFSGSEKIQVSHLSPLLPPPEP